MVREVFPTEIASATGGFHSLAEVGEGGFGKVYRAMLNHRPVAIKVMASGGLQGKAEFDNELSLLSRLNHAHLVRLLGVCRSSDPSLRCLVYELMPAGNVEEQLASQIGRSVLPWWLRLRVAAQAAAAVAYLHTLPAAIGGPLIHRDIKPANIFLDGRLNAKLGDVGLAIPAAAATAAKSSSSKLAEEQAMVGTYPYLPPEYKSSGALSVKTDVYALGVSLLQLATGQLERLQELVPRCKEAVAAGQSAQVIDSKAGTWDEAAGERLLCLGLWCCADAAVDRPDSQQIATEMAKLWVAADQAIRRAQQQQAAAAAGGWAGSGPSAGMQMAAGSSNSSDVRQQPWQQQGHGAVSDATNSPWAVTGSGPSGSGGSFWRFITSGGPQTCR